MINLNSKSKKLLLLQRNELLSKRQKWLRKKFGRLIFTNIFINFFQHENIEKITEELFEKEIKTFENFLPKSVYNIMDIGCGLGIINIKLNKFFLNKPHFFLLDKNRVDKKIKYGFSDNYESYNDLNETKNILLDNKIDKNCINLFDVEKPIEINKKIDLIISLKSMGYHYPLELYLELFKKCCTSKTTFIFDVNESYYDKNLLGKYFENIEIIYEEKSIHPLKRLFCKNFNFLNT